jgi:hypothetical protein
MYTREAWDRVCWELAWDRPPQSEKNEKKGNEENQKRVDQTENTENQNDKKHIPASVAADNVNERITVAMPPKSVTGPKQRPTHLPRHFIHQ